MSLFRCADCGAENERTANRQLRCGGCARAIHNARRRKGGRVGAPSPARYNPPKDWADLT